VFGDGARGVIEGMEPLEGISGLCGEIALLLLSSRDDTLSGWRIGCCTGGAVIEEERGG
jgi:hypothetical protein